MNTYYCLLGNTPLFSIAELKAVLPLVRIEMLNDAVAQIDLASDTEATDLLDTLGGTIKIIRHIEHFETKPDDEDILLSSSKILLLYLT